MVEGQRTPVFRRVIRTLCSCEISRSFLSDSGGSSPEREVDWALFRLFVATEVGTWAGEGGLRVC